MYTSIIVLSYVKILVKMRTKYFLEIGFWTMYRVIID